MVCSLSGCLQSAPNSQFSEDENSSDDDSLGHTQDDLVNGQPLAAGPAGSPHTYVAFLDAAPQHGSDYHCTGLLYQGRWVITARHCLEEVILSGGTLRFSFPASSVPEQSYYGKYALWERNKVWHSHHDDDVALVFLDRRPAITGSSVLSFQTLPTFSARAFGRMDSDGSHSWDRVLFKDAWVGSDREPGEERDIWRTFGGEISHEGDSGGPVYGNFLGSSAFRGLIVANDRVERDDANCQCRQWQPTTNVVRFDQNAGFMQRVFGANPTATELASLGFKFRKAARQGRVYSFPASMEDL
jgi:hypothetical protein